MINRLLAAAVCAAIAAGAHAQDAKPAKPLDALAFLAGSCWEGPFPDGKSTDRHCYTWIQDGSYLRDNSTLVGANPPYYGETTYYWDHSAKAVKYLYLAKGGGYSTGSVVIKDKTRSFPDERYVGPTGEIPVRAEMTVIDNDSYIMRSEMQDKQGTWQPMLNGTYRRKPLN